MLNVGTFFKDRYGVDSMPALLLFLSFWPATYVMVVNHTENLYYAYMAAYAGLAANKQWATRNVRDMDNDQLADGSVGSGSVVTHSSTTISQPLAQPSPPVPKSPKRTR